MTNAQSTAILTHIATWIKALGGNTFCTNCDEVGQLVMIEFNPDPFKAVLKCSYCSYKLTISILSSTE